MLELPIGIQSFKELRTGGYLYVDKTRHIYELAKRKYYFLSRPRRFGKSLLVSTLKELYEGNRALFDDLWIADKWDWEKRHPVVHIPFSSIGYKEIGLEAALHKRLDDIAVEYGLPKSIEALSLKFSALITHLAEKSKVVLLIDEYDKPIIDYLGDELPQAQANQKILKTFYSVLKDSDEYLELVFITGVSRFSKVSIFSDLNNIDDITLNKHYADIAGYTQQELEDNFKGYISLLQASSGNRHLLEKIKKWFNGYSWDSRSFVYNPFSILLLFGNMDFKNFWFQTATPTFLINLIRDRQLYDFDDIIVGQTIFDSYDIQSIDVVALLFQTGHLTIKEIDEFGLYRLGYPNKEVRDSMLDYLIGGFGDTAASSVAPMIVQIRTAFIKNELGKVRSIINGLLKNIPYQIFEQTEAFYHAIIHLTFFYLGVFIESEVCTSDGRADVIVQTDTHIYCLEFKLNESGEAAIDQIEQKGYLKKFAHTGKQLVGLGVNLSTAEKKIDGWVVKNLS